MSGAPIAVVGSVNIDIVVRAPRLPGPGETLHGDSFVLTLGGKGANQAVAAARLGAEVALVARTGADGFGDMARRALTGFGLDLGQVGIAEGGGTGIAAIAVDAAGQNAITIVAGANARLGPADLDAAASALAGARVLMLQGETPIPTSLEAARRVKAGGGQVILDPAPVPAEGIAAFAGLADIVTPNESEASALTGVAVTDRQTGLAAARRLVAQGFAVAVVKCGAEGVAWSGRLGEGQRAAIPVAAVDTVAAGDCFNAGLAVALAEGRPLADSILWAMAAGALAVTRPGAAEAAPTRAEVAALVTRIAG